MGCAPGWLSGRLFIPKDSDQAKLIKQYVPAIVFRPIFVQGGLVLSFAFHHAVMDGPSIKRFLQVSALGCTRGMKHWTVYIADRERFLYSGFDAA